jgi:lysine 2,3-aminomutase
MRIRPYYLYQCDPIIGSQHFKTEIEVGLDIIKSLRGFTSGYAIPQYVIDAPGGGGKIPLVPNSVVSEDTNFIYLQNYEGEIFKYPKN